MRIKRKLSLLLAAVMIITAIPGMNSKTILEVQAADAGGTPQNETVVGFTKAAPHSHSFTYSLATTTTTNDTIKATCSDSDGNCGLTDKSVSLTITATSANYSGSPVVATMDTTEWEAAGLEVPTIKYVGKAPTNYSETTVAPFGIGTYIAKITVGGQTATKDFAIKGWVSVLDQDEINEFLTKVVGAYEDRDYPEYDLLISNNAGSGFGYKYCGVNANFGKLLQNGNEYFLEIAVVNVGPSVNGPHGYTFVFDGDTMTNCYQVQYDGYTFAVTDYYKYPFKHKHTWNYEADGATITCRSRCQGENLCEFTDEQTYSLTLTANIENYTGVEGLATFNAGTRLNVKEGDVLFYKVATAGATTGGTDETSTPPTESGYYYAALTVEGQKAVKAFTIGGPTDKFVKMQGYLDELIGLDFKIYIPEEFVEKAVKMEFDVDGVKQYVDFEDATKVKINNQDCYVFRCLLNSTQMKSDITAKMIYSDGIVGTTKVVSFNTYLGKLKDAYSGIAELMALVDSMDVFGDSMKAYEDKNMSNVPDDIDLTSEEQTYVESYVLNSEGIDISDNLDKIKPLTVRGIMGTRMAVKVKYECTEDGDYKFFVDGQAVTATKITGDGGKVYYEVVSPDVAPTDYGKTIKFTVKLGETEENYLQSPLKYAINCMDDDNYKTDPKYISMFKSIIKYHHTALKYKEAK